MLPRNRDEKKQGSFLSYPFKFSGPFTSGSRMVKRFLPTKQPCKESEFRNPRKFCLWNPKSWVLESGIQLEESRIPLTIGIHNPSSTDKDHGIRNLEFVIRGVESRIQDCLEFPYTGRQLCFFNLTYYNSNKKSWSQLKTLQSFLGPKTSHTLRGPALVNIRRGALSPLIKFTQGRTVFCFYITLR